MARFAETITPTNCDDAAVKAAAAELLLLIGTRQVEFPEVRRLRDALKVVKEGHQLRGLPAVLEARYSVLDDVVRRVEARIPIIAEAIREGSSLRDVADRIVHTPFEEAP